MSHTRQILLKKPRECPNLPLAAFLPQSLYSFTSRTTQTQRAQTCNGCKRASQELICVCDCLYFSTPLSHVLAAGKQHGIVPFPPRRRGNVLEAGTNCLRVSQSAWGVLKVDPTECFALAGESAAGCGCLPLSRFNNSCFLCNLPDGGAAKVIATLVWLANIKLVMQGNLINQSLKRSPIQSVAKHCSCTKSGWKALLELSSYMATFVNIRNCYMSKHNLHLFFTKGKICMFFCHRNLNLNWERSLDALERSYFHFV